MKKTKQKVTFYSVLVNGVVIKDFKSHAPASSYKNKRNNPDRIEMMKYCKFCKKETLHRETK